MSKAEKLTVSVDLEESFRLEAQTNSRKYLQIHFGTIAEINGMETKFSKYKFTS